MTKVALEIVVIAARDVSGRDDVQGSILHNQAEKYSSALHRSQDETQNSPDASPL